MLSIVNNINSLTAQTNLGKSSSALSKSLERLSTGLKINSGSDGPAALVISEQQRSQIAGLQTALDNSNKAVSLVQTGEGALNEINALLTKARSLALDSANTGVNDATAQAANQAEVTNILASIDNISATTKFGTKNLLNGAAQDGGLTTSTSGVNITGTLSSIPATKTQFTYNVTAASTRASITNTAGFAGGTLGAAGNLLVVASGITTTAAVVSGDTVDTVVGKLNAQFQSNGASVIASNVGGQLKLTATDYKTNIATTGSTAGVLTALGTATNNARTAATLTYTDSTNAVISASSVITGTNDSSVITLTGELAGAIVKLDNSPTTGSLSTVAPTGAVFQVGQKLTFQIGANAGETSTLSINRTGSTSLGVGVDATYTSLNAINLSSAAGAQAAISVIDQATKDISTIRGQLGAFQANTLESNSRSLTTTLQNTTSALSVIRDTDFAAEIANYTRLQVQTQAGSTVLGNANQTSALIAQLLQKA